MKRYWLFLLLLLLLLGGTTYFVGPRAIMLAYGRYPDAVPPQLLSWVATPLPTALPAPIATAQPIAIDVLLDVNPTTNSTQLPITNTPITNTPITTTPIPNTPTPTPQPLPTAVRLQNIDIIPQKFNNCGPANLSINLAYHGVAIGQLEIGSAIKPNYDDRNVSPHEMVDYVNNNTALTATAYAGGTMQMLKAFLAAGYPVIIEKGLYPNDWEGWMGHYLTMVGYDDSTEEMVSLDTFLGPWDGNGRIDSYDTIETFWQQFNYTFILVYPPADQPIIDDIVGDLRNPETMWREAAFTAQQQTNSQPDNPYAWFNLGSSLTELGHLTGNATFYESAASAFDQARTVGLPWRMLWYQFAPYEAYLAVGRYDDVLQLSDAILTSSGGQNVEETYLYRGHALMALGEETAAHSAYARAESLNPNLQLEIGD